MVPESGNKEASVKVTEVPVPPVPAVSAKRAPSKVSVTSPVTVPPY